MKTERFNWESKIVQSIELLIDTALVLFGMGTVLYLQGEFDVSTIGNTFNFFRDLIITNSIQLVVIVIFFRVYKTSITKNSFSKVMPRIFLALLMTEILLVFSSLFITGFTFSKLAFLYSFFVQLVYLGIFKFIFYSVYKRVNIKSVIIIGDKEDVQSLAAKLLLSNSYIKIKYLIYESQTHEGQLDTIFKYIDKVEIVYMTPKLNATKKNAIIQYSISQNKTFILIPKIYEIAIINASIAQIGDVLAYEVNGLEMSFENKVFKRSFDVFVSIIGIILSSPLMIIFAILIKREDGGPVFFKQERLTIHNRKFILIKFRTMIVNAESSSGPVFASENDPRITKIGNIMRKLRIDELPQFFNIIKGDMSIVGPRPEREFFVEQFIKENSDYKYRMLVKAGVTGLAQALGSYNTNFEDKLRFDLYYIRTYSICQDLSILLHTIRAIFDKNSTKGIDETSDFNEVLEFNNLFLLESSSVPFLVRVIEK